MNRLQPSRPAPQSKEPSKEISELNYEMMYNTAYISELLEFQYEKSMEKKLTNDFSKLSITSTQRSLIVKYLIKITVGKSFCH